MSAHLRELSLQCNHQYCHSRAVVEVYNTFNEPFGKFCRKHGNERVKDLLKSEVAIVRARQEMMGR